MNTLDTQLLHDLAALPGWDDLTATASATPTPETLSRSTAAVREAIAADASRAMNADLIRARARPLSTGRRRRTRWVVAAVTAAAAAALLVAAPTISTPGNAPVSVASASEFLTRLAGSATAAQGIDEAYWKVRFTSINPMNPAPGSRNETETTLWYGRTGGQWIATGGGEVIKVSGSAAQFALPYDAALTWTQVSRLPTDAGSLDATLRSLIGKGSVADAAANLLATAPLNADQRRALFTILSHQRDVTLREGVKDTAGRTGTALDFHLGTTSTMTLVIAEDGTLLEESQTAAIDHDTALDSPQPTGASSSAAARQTTKKGQIQSRATYLDVGGTNTAPEN